MPSSTRPCSITPKQVARLRMQALALHQVQGGSAAMPATPLDVVRHHLAMQSQEWGASRWAIGSRLDGARDQDVLDAYDRAEIVRSWPMRGTMHAVASEDLRWMLDLMGVRALAGVARRWQILGIDEALLERARDVAIERLRGGRCCSRAELQEVLVEAGLDLAGQRAYHVVWYLSQTGTTVLGPTRKREQLLVLLDEWVRQPRRWSRDEALAELGRRYLWARGPATLEDLAHWSKLTKGDCRLAIEANRDALVDLDCAGTPHLMLRERWEQLDPDATSGDRQVHALAAFDEHLLGYRVRDAVLAPAHANHVDPGRNGVFRWTIVVGGRVVATWRRTKRARRIVADVSPFTTLPRGSRTAVDRAIGRYGVFVGSPIEVVVGGG